jgi:hypothetical protein
MSSSAEQRSARAEKRRAPRQRPSARLRVGEIVLARASALETAPLDRALARFAGLHDAYVDAQRSVVEFEAALATGRRRLRELDARVNAAIEALAVSLACDRRPRLRPFQGYSRSCPSLLRRMAAPRKDRTIRTLVNAVLRDRKLSPPSAAAARDLEAALDALRSESSALAAMEAEARRCRTRRDAIGLQWDRALVALRLVARMAAADGATQLYEILFRKPFPRYLP